MLELCGWTLFNAIENETKSTGAQRVLAKIEVQNTESKNPNDKTKYMLVVDSYPTYDTIWVHKDGVRIAGAITLGQALLMVEQESTIFKDRAVQFGATVVTEEELQKMEQKGIR